MGAKFVLFLRIVSRLIRRKKVKEATEVTVYPDSWI